MRDGMMNGMNDMTMMNGKKMLCSFVPSPVTFFEQLSFFCSFVFSFSISFRWLNQSAGLVALGTKAVPG